MEFVMGVTVLVGAVNVVGWWIRPPELPTIPWRKSDVRTDETALLRSLKDAGWKPTFRWP